VGETEFCRKYSACGMPKVLHRLNLSYPRPSYTLAKAEPQKEEEFKEGFAALKRTSRRKIGRLLFEEDSTIRDYQGITKKWFERGKHRLTLTQSEDTGLIT
jgi:hypothetical protein